MDSLNKTILILITVGMLACGRQQKEAESDKMASSQLSNAQIETMSTKEIVETVCQNCHHPTARPDDRLAPPLVIAKRNYLASNPDKEGFVDAMTTFILSPTPEQAKLHSDVENFGVMDPLGYSEEQIRSVAAYIYETELEKPDWLE